MKKETTVAIILGILAGIGIAIFVIFTSQSATTDDADVLVEDITPTVSVETNQIDPLLINEPEDDLVTENDSITVSGTAQENALVVIQSLTDEVVVQNENGSFEQDIQLVPGENTIRITAYNNKNIDSRTLTIYSINVQ